MAPAELFWLATVFISLLPGLEAQNVQCVEVADGCDGGSSHETSIRAAIARFQDGQYYGGSESVVMSSALEGDNLAMITYSCQDGSTPPRLEGPALRSSAEKILSCSNQCGGIAVAENLKCGIGVLVAANAAGADCFSKATNVVPHGISPQVVPSVDSFQNPRCLVDSVAARILTNGSRVDYGRDGMTVEKCALLAADETWRYAGVEYGGECYWGDDEINTQSVDLAECDMSCAGDSRQACGDSNRILVYENTEYLLQTRPDLGVTCQQFVEALAELATSLQQWHTAVVQYQTLLNNQLDTQLRKRSIAPRQDTMIMRAFRDVQESYDTLLSRKARIDASIAVVRKLFEVARRKTRVKPGEYELVVRNIEQPVTKVLESISSPRAVIRNVGDSAVTVVQIAEDSVAIIGTREILTTAGQVIVAAGVFAALVELIQRLLGTTTGDSTASTLTANPSTTATATSTTSSSSTTTCTETSTPTPIIIVTKYGTTDSEYDALVHDLPKTAEARQFRGVEIGNWWILATLDQCTSEALWNNAIVEAMAIDKAIVLGEDDSPQILDEESTPPRQEAATKVEPSPGLLVERKLERRDLPETSHLLEQTNSPNHLKWISGLSRQTGLTGPFYDFENYVYDDQARSTLQFQPFVYIIDPTGFVEHEDYKDRIRMHIVAHLDSVDASPTDGVVDAHGTNMASLAAGDYAGVAKNALLGLIKLQRPLSGTPSTVSSTMFAFDEILRHSYRANTRGGSVISMSFKVAVTNRTWWRRPGENVPRNGLEAATDVFGVKLKDAFRAGIAAVNSAGNDATWGQEDVRDLSYFAPRRNGGATTPLIVVGNSDINSQRYYTSNYLDRFGKGILSVYNIGCDTVAGHLRLGVPQGTVQDSFRLLTGPFNGASQATALTAGVIAQFLSDWNVRRQLNSEGRERFAMKVKDYLLNLAVAQKGQFPDGIPRVANGMAVSCSAGAAAIAGRPTIPAPITPPETQTGLRAQRREVSQGSSLVVNPLASLPPACYNLQ